MRIGVIADVHANLLALDAVLADGDRFYVDRWICLGDVVGYGPEPRACLQRCAQRRIQCITGNHEARLLGLPTVRFNAMAEAAIVFAAEQVGEEGRALLSEFGDIIELDGEALFCHGSPDDRDAYLFSPSHLQSVWDDQRHALVFCGHTHQQFVFDGTEVRTHPGEIALDGARVLVNPGSVGQPRDGDPRAAFAIWDRARRRLELRRVRYDVDEQIRRTRAAGLPDHLALRLELGR